MPYPFTFVTDCAFS